MNPVVPQHNPTHNQTQNKAFLKLTREQQAYWIEWLKTLPLWLDLGGARVGGKRFVDCGVLGLCQVNIRSSGLRPTP